MITKEDDYNFIKRFMREWPEVCKSLKSNKTDLSKIYITVNPIDYAKFLGLTK